MVGNLGFEIPRNVQNIKHDFRIAIYSFTRSFLEVNNFSFGDSKEKAELIIKPQGITNVTFGCSVASTPQSGEFTILGGVDAEEELSSTITGENPENRLPNKIAGGTRFIGDVESRTMDIGAMFSTTPHVIKPMDYVIIYTKDVRTNMWYGSKQIAQSNVPNDAKPKYIGIVREVITSYNAQTNRMEFTVRFNTMLRLVELARYSMEYVMYAALDEITGKPYNSFEKNVLRMSNTFWAKPPHEIIKLSLEPDYPKELLGKRVEIDQLRGEPQNLDMEKMYPAFGQGNFHYDTKLNKIRQIATNKDFEFYSDEEGQIVWKLPTYARGINLQSDNKITTELFNPDDPNHDGLYHIHEFISANIQVSEEEIVNVMSGPNDFKTSIGVINYDFMTHFRYTYYIRGGKTTPPEQYQDRRFGFEDVGVRPLQMTTPMGVNLGDDVNQSHMFYYDFKAYKNNIGRYITGSITMIDDPRIKCGMPIVIPLFAEAGRGKLKGRLVPSIFYIAATQRRYEYQKAPILVLTLTHGRFIDEEFHNGIHTFGKVSSWISRAEPHMVEDVISTKVTKRILANDALDEIDKDIIIHQLVDSSSNDNRLLWLKQYIDRKREEKLAQRKQDVENQDHSANNDNHDHAH